MNWHERYVQQATWTRELRHYVLGRSRWSESQRVLEVGCGTGAVFADNAAAMGNGNSTPRLYGLDISASSLSVCRQHVPQAVVVCGDAAALPFESARFEITYCHYLLLWLSEPVRALREMRRVTEPSGYVIAFAEPDYSARVDSPPELVELGKQQNAALAEQGVALHRGAELSDLFREAGIGVIETGPIQTAGTPGSSALDFQEEWRILESDLDGKLTSGELQRLHAIDQAAIQRGERRISVPTYFAWGQV